MKSFVLWRFSGTCFNEWIKIICQAHISFSHVHGVQVPGNDLSRIVGPNLIGLLPSPKSLDEKEF